VVIAVVILAATFIKLNSTKKLQHVQVPFKIGLVYIQGTAIIFPMRVLCDILSLILAPVILVGWLACFESCAVLSLLRLVALRWPSVVHDTLSAMSLSVLNFGLFATQCWITFQASFYVISYIPFVLFSVLLLCYGVLWHARRPSRPAVSGWIVQRLAPDLGNGLQWNSSEYLHGFQALLCRTFLSFLSFSYTFLAWEPISIFDCVNINGKPRLRDFVRVECYSGEWNSYLFTAILGMLLYPLGIVALIYWTLRRWDYGDKPGAAAMLGSQVMAYRTGYRWWELVGLLWKLCMVLVLRLLLEYPTAQVVLFLLLLTARIVVQRLVQPFASPLNNRHETWLMGLTFAVMCIGVIFYAGNDSISTDGVRTLYVFAMLLIVTLLGSIVYFVIQAYRMPAYVMSAQGTDGDRDADDTEGSPELHKLTGYDGAALPSSEGERSTAARMLHSMSSQTGYAAHVSEDGLPQMEHQLDDSSAHLHDARRPLLG